MSLKIHHKPERQSIVAGIRFFFKFVKLVFQSLRTKYAIPVLLLVLLLLFGAFYEFIAYQVGLIVSEFYGALTTKSYEKFLNTVKLSILYVLGISVIIAIQSMISGHLTLFLRDALTTRLHIYYFQIKRFYTINSLIDLDNPDQRFTQDVDTVCSTLTEMIPIIAIRPLLVIFYTYKCVERAGWLGPISAYILFVVFTILSRLLTTWTSEAYYERDRQEGNFRYLHTQLRSSCESAALLDVGQSQQYYARTSFQRLLRAFRVNINRRALLLFVTTLSDYTGGVLNYWALGIVLFGGLFGTMTSSEITVLISQTSFFLLYLINQLTTLISLANRVALLNGVGYRIITLDDYLTECSQHSSPAAYAISRFPDMCAIEPTDVPPREWTSKETDSIFIQLDHISLGLPANPNHILIQDLSLTVRLNDSLLITGPSGTGKTALLRMLADLWPALPSSTDGYHNSRFYRSSVFTYMFIPQQPYFPSSDSCPAGLFDVLEFAVDKSYTAKPEVRALHLSYMLLTLCEYPITVDVETCDELSAFVALPPQASGLSAPVSSVNEAFTIDESSIQPTFDASDLLERADHRGYLCGYPIHGFIKAIKLLMEFRLVHLADVKYLVERLCLFGMKQRPKVQIRSCAHRAKSVCHRIRSVVRRGCQPVLHESKIENRDWHTCYSPGEMQRLLLASVCYRSPQFAFLDEATSQVTTDDMAQAYDSLTSRNITTISVAHHPDVVRYHKYELKLFPSSEPNASGDISDAHHMTKFTAEQSCRWQLVHHRE